MTDPRSSKETIEAEARMSAERAAKVAATAPKQTAALTNEQLAALRTEAQRLGRSLTNAEVDSVLGK
jgi:hypothetical protein